MEGKSEFRSKPKKVTNIGWGQILENTYTKCDFLDIRWRIKNFWLKFHKSVEYKGERKKLKIAIKIFELRLANAFFHSYTSRRNGLYKNPSIV